MLAGLVLNVGVLDGILAPGIVILVRFDTGELFPVGKKTASNIVGAILFDALPRVAQRQIRSCESLLRFAKHG
jgi:hypothetical protein